jgi:predicted GTPase
VRWGGAKGPSPGQNGGRHASYAHDHHGAAGRDFHNFNVAFRDDPAFEVVAFTVAQIPNIEGRVYPPSLAGTLYPAGIPIYPEEELESLIRGKGVGQVMFAYSDVSHEDVMHKASRALAAGDDFSLLGPRRTQLRSRRPVVSVCAVRTGAGKSQTTRRVLGILRGLGYRAVPVRHPMPYGDLARQAVQRFATPADLDLQDCTIEEREEYEPLLSEGVVVYAGVDYGRILRRAEEEADIIVWDGGNNDLPFFAPDVHIVVADPHRPGHENTYHPGEASARAADVFLINKVDTAAPEDVLKVRRYLLALNRRAAVVEAASPVHVDDPEAISGQRAVVVEDGPTLTHGGASWGAGWLAARQYGGELVDPRPFAAGSIRDAYLRHPHIGPVLPALGYGREMIRELEETVNQAEADVVVAGTPIDLTRVLRLNKPAVRARYELKEIGRPKPRRGPGRPLPPPRDCPSLVVTMPSWRNVNAVALPHT